MTLGHLMERLFNRSRLPLRESPRRRAPLRMLSGVPIFREVRSLNHTANAILSCRDIRKQGGVGGSSAISTAVNAGLAITSVALNANGAGSSGEGPCRPGPGGGAEYGYIFN